MFDPGSRYERVEDATLVTTDADGRERPVAYKRRRFVPPVSASVPLVDHTFQAGERLDTVTARYLGDPTRFWQVCDAQEVLRPAELTEEVGDVIRIAMPRL